MNYEIVAVPKRAGEGEEKILAWVSEVSTVEPARALLASLLPVHWNVEIRRIEKKEGAGT